MTQRQKESPFHESPFHESPFHESPSHGQSIVAQLIEAEELHDQLHDQLHNPKYPAIKLIDCRFHLQDTEAGRNAYWDAHLPNAHYLHLNEDLSSEVKFRGGRHPLPNLPTFANKIAKLGINPRTRVVIYDDQRGAYATRTWWLLNHIGIHDCWILNGGFSAWKTLNLPVSSKSREESQATKGLDRTELGTNGEKPDEESTPYWYRGGALPTVDYNHLANGHLRGDTIVYDAREAIRYSGEKEPIDPIAGHIPGAINAPWQENIDESGFFKSRQALKKHWRELLEQAYRRHQPQSQHRPPPSQSEGNHFPVVHYCGSGVTACVNIFAMGLAGYATSTLYPGSWSDWCSHFDKP